MSDKQWSPPTVTELIHRRAWELMSDGQWRDYERVVQELMKVIPAGMALRRERRRWEMTASTPSRLKDRGEPRERWEWRSEEERVRLGRRDWVVATIQSRPGRSVQAMYETDPPSTQLAGGNRYGRYVGRKIRVVRPNRVILGDLRRLPWLRPVLDHLASEMLAQGDEWAAGRVRVAAHENGFHLVSCPPGCTLSPDPIEPLQDGLDEGTQAVGDPAADPE